MKTKDLWLDINWLEDPTEPGTYVTCDEYSNYYMLRLDHIEELNPETDDDEELDVLPINRLEWLSVEERNELIKHEALHLCREDWKRIMTERNRLGINRSVHGNRVGRWSVCNDLVGLEDD